MMTFALDLFAGWIKRRFRHNAAMGGAGYSAFAFALLFLRGLGLGATPHKPSRL